MQKQLNLNLMNRILIILAAVLSTVIAEAQSVGINTNTPNPSAQLDVSSTTKGFLPPRMDSTQRNAISSKAVGLIIYNTTIKSLEYWNGTNWYSTVHFIGENFGGGIVFFIYDGGKHGLIAATVDQSTGIQWYNGISTTTNAVRDGINAGQLNTERIISNQGVGSYASQICANYLGGGYGDWYLPSKSELILLSLQNTLFGIFGNYWSSNEYDNNSLLAWVQSVSGPSATTTNKSFAFPVRAIRAF